MEAIGKNVDPDIVGRVMALEQKARGLYGRVGALEMRFSAEPGEAPAFDDMEFVPGEPRQEPLEARVAALEAAITTKPAVQKMSMLDVTGLVVGLSLLGVGVLLATDSVDLLRNPLLAFGAGVVIIACAAWRVLLK
jgi:hypothetical protein